MGKLTKIDRNRLRQTDIDLKGQIQAKRKETNRTRERDLKKEGNVTQMFKQRTWKLFERERESEDGGRGGERKTISLMLKQKRIKGLNKSYKVLRQQREREE